MFAGEHNREGFTSILSSRCAGCNTVFSFATSSRIQGITGGEYWDVTLPLCGGKWLQVEGTHR